MISHLTSFIMNTKRISFYMENFFKKGKHAKIEVGYLENSQLV